MVVLYILICLMALIMVVLFAPVRYRAAGTVGTDTDARVDISWLCKLIYVGFMLRDGNADITVRLAGRSLVSQQPKKQTASKPHQTNEPHIKKTKKKAAAPPQTGEAKTQAKTPKKPRRMTDRWETLKAVLTYPERKSIMNIAMLFIKKTLRAIRPDGLDVEGVVGLGDPYATGLLLGAYEAVAGMTRLRRSVRLSGDFNKQALRLRIRLNGHICFGHLLWPLVWLCTRRPVFHILMLYIKKEKRKDESDGKREC